MFVQAFYLLPYKATELHLSRRWVKMQTGLFPYKGVMCCPHPWLSQAHLGFYLKRKIYQRPRPLPNARRWKGWQKCLHCARQWSTYIHCDLGLKCNVIKCKCWGCSWNYHTWVERGGATFGGVLVYPSSSSMSQPALLPYDPSAFWLLLPFFSAAFPSHIRSKMVSSFHNESGWIYSRCVSLQLLLCD